jgi:hypothetical protein
MGAGGSVPQKWDDFGQTSPEQVAAIVAGMGEQFVPYKQCIVDNNVSGDTLLKVKTSQTDEVRFARLNTSIEPHYCYVSKGSESDAFVSFINDVGISNDEHRLFIAQKLQALAGANTERISLAQSASTPIMPSQGAHGTVSEDKADNGIVSNDKDVWSDMCKRLDLDAEMGTFEVITETIGGASRNRFGMGFGIPLHLC